ncbi:hypothetical protein DSM02_3502 [Leeuwenhoekiella polynyae]|uniref:Uncharacterized protein n=1 Tax=Leeuwenhoekiella polynyae TaxID=1550906 RepID=A0A4Q0NV71_9FLAO|nr:hypothetical protein DSM02_3502 [Leeuwenhoekiella polynyae]
MPFNIKDEGTANPVKSKALVTDKSLVISFSLFNSFNLLFDIVA